MDKVRLREIVTILAESFGREITAGLLEGYWIGLRDLPDSEVETAAARCVKECRFMPTPSELRERCNALPRIRADFAWTTLVDAIRLYGWNANVQFADVVIGHVVRRMGGWEVVTGQESGELHKWGRKEFLDAYEMLDGEREHLDVLTLEGAHARHDREASLIPAPYLACIPKVEEYAGKREPGEEG